MSIVFHCLERRIGFFGATQKSTQQWQTLYLLLLYVEHAFGRERIYFYQVNERWFQVVTRARDAYTRRELVAQDDTSPNLHQRCVTKSGGADESTSDLEKHRSLGNTGVF